MVDICGRKNLVTDKFIEEVASSLMVSSYPNKFYLQNSPKKISKVRGFLIEVASNPIPVLCLSNCLESLYNLPKYV